MKMNGMLLTTFSFMMAVLWSSVLIVVILCSKDRIFLRFSVYPGFVRYICFAFCV